MGNFCHFQTLQNEIMKFLVDLIGDPNPKILGELSKAFIQLIPRLHFERHLGQSAKETHQNEFFVTSSLPSLQPEFQLSQEQMIHQNLSHIVSSLMGALHTSFPGSRQSSYAIVQILTDISCHFSSHFSKDPRTFETHPVGDYGHLSHATAAGGSTSTQANTNSSPTISSPAYLFHLTHNPGHLFLGDIIPWALQQLSSTAISLDLQAHTTLLKLLSSLTRHSKEQGYPYFGLIFAHAFQLLRIFEVVEERITPGVMVKTVKDDPSDVVPDFTAAVLAVHQNLNSSPAASSSPATSTFTSTATPAPATTASSSNSTPLQQPDLSLSSSVLGGASLSSLNSKIAGGIAGISGSKQVSSLLGSVNLGLSSSSVNNAVPLGALSPTSSPTPSNPQDPQGEATTPSAKGALLIALGAQKSLPTMGTPPAQTEATNTHFLKLARMVANTYRTWNISSFPKDASQDAFPIFLEACVECLVSSLEGLTHWKREAIGEPPFQVPFSRFDDTVSCLDAAYVFAPEASLQATLALLNLASTHGASRFPRGNPLAGSLAPHDPTKREDDSSAPLYEQIFLRPRSRFSNSLLVTSSFLSKMIISGKRDPISVATTTAPFSGTTRVTTQGGSSHPPGDDRDQPASPIASSRLSASGTRRRNSALVGSSSAKTAPAGSPSPPSPAATPAPPQGSSPPPPSPSPSPSPRGSVIKVLEPLIVRAMNSYRDASFHNERRYIHYSYFQMRQDRHDEINLQVSVLAILRKLLEFRVNYINQRFLALLTRQLDISEKEINCLSQGYIFRLLPDVCEMLLCLATGWRATHKTLSVLNVTKSAEKILALVISREERKKRLLRLWTEKWQALSWYAILSPFTENLALLTGYLEPHEEPYFLELVSSLLLSFTSHPSVLGSLGDMLRHYRGMDDPPAQGTVPDASSSKYFAFSKRVLGVLLPLMTRGSVVIQSAAHLNATYYLFNNLCSHVLKSPAPPLSAFFDLLGMGGESFSQAVGQDDAFQISTLTQPLLSASRVHGFNISMLPVSLVLLRVLSRFSEESLVAGVQQLSSSLMGEFTGLTPHELLLSAFLRIVRGILGTSFPMHASIGTPFVMVGDIPTNFPFMVQCFCELLQYILFFVQGNSSSPATAPFVAASRRFIEDGTVESINRRICSLVSTQPVIVLYWSQLLSSLGYTEHSWWLFLLQQGRLGVHLSGGSTLGKARDNNAPFRTSLAGLNRMATEILARGVTVLLWKTAMSNALSLGNSAAPDEQSKELRRLQIIIITEHFDQTIIRDIFRMTRNLEAQGRSPAGAKGGAEGDISKLEEALLSHLRGVLGAEDEEWRLSYAHPRQIHTKFECLRWLPATTETFRLLLNLLHHSFHAYPAEKINQFLLDYLEDAVARLPGSGGDSKQVIKGADSEGGARLINQRSVVTRVLVDSDRDLVNVICSFLKEGRLQVGQLQNELFTKASEAFKLFNGSEQEPSEVSIFSATLSFSRSLVNPEFVGLVKKLIQRRHGLVWNTVLVDSMVVTLGWARVSELILGEIDEERVRSKSLSLSQKLDPSGEVAQSVPFEEPLSTLSTLSSLPASPVAPPRRSKPESRLFELALLRSAIIQGIAAPGSGKSSEMALLLFVQEALQEATAQKTSQSKAAAWNTSFFLCTFVTSLMEAALGQVVYSFAHPGPQQQASGSFTPGGGDLALSPTQMLAHKCLSLLGKTTIFTFFADFFDFYQEALATGLVLPFHHFVALEAAHLLTLWCSQSFSPSQLRTEDPLGEIRGKIELLLSHAPPPSAPSSLLHQLANLDTKQGSPLKFLLPYLAAMPSITPQNGIGESLDLSARSLTSYRLTKVSQLLLIRLTHLCLPRFYDLLLQAIGILDETGEFVGGKFVWGLFTFFPPCSQNPKPRFLAYYRRKPSVGL